MKTAIYRITLLCTAALALQASAQSLKKEITVRHESSPERIATRRLDITPVINLPKSSASHLDYSSRDVRIDVPVALTTLAPASYGDTLPSSPFKGYASLGFMTPFNLDLSAGYKFLDTDRTRLNGWLQYNGTAYRSHKGDFEFRNEYFRRHTATAGLTLRQAVGQSSFIDAGANYTFSRYNAPFLEFEQLDYRSVNRANVKAMWTMNSQSFFCGVGAGFSHFSYSADIPQEEIESRPAAENIFRVMASLGGFASDSQRLGIDMDLSYVSNNATGSLGWGLAYGSFYHAMINGPLNTYRHGLATFAPYYRFSINNFDLDLGALVQLTIKSGKAFHIAPNASATWRPASAFNIYVKAGGGEVQNTLASLYDVTPYATPLLNYRNSHVPLTAEAGLTIGPWHGAYIGASATYARANDWLMPAAGLSPGLATWFAPVNMRGYKLAVKAGYSFRSLLSLDLTAETAPQGYDRGYYLWRDRARYVLDASLSITPIRPLDITIGWTFRDRRRQALLVSGETDGVLSLRSEMFSLNNISDLHINASYRITPRWSAFASASNLLNRTYFLIGAIPAQGITGMVGANYNF